MKCGRVHCRHIAVLRQRNVIALLTNKIYVYAVHFRNVRVRNDRIDTDMRDSCSRMREKERPVMEKEC